MLACECGVGRGRARGPRRTLLVSPFLCYVMLLYGYVMRSKNVHMAVRSSAAEPETFTPERGCLAPP